MLGRDLEQSASRRRLRPADSRIRSKTCRHRSVGRHGSPECPTSIRCRRLSSHESGCLGPTAQDMKAPAGLSRRPQQQTQTRSPSGPLETSTQQRRRRGCLADLRPEERGSPWFRQLLTAETPMSADRVRRSDEAYRREIRALRGWDVLKTCALTDGRTPESGSETSSGAKPWHAWPPSESDAEPFGARSSPIPPLEQGGAAEGVGPVQGGRTRLR